MKLYKWQTECLSRWEANDYHGIINVVTGAGKTAFALAAVRMLSSTLSPKEKVHETLSPALRVKIVVPTVALAAQWKMTVTSAFSIVPGIYGGNYRDNADEHSIMIYVINSARQVLSSHIRREFSLDRHVMLICDECHHYQSDANSKIFGFLMNKMPGEAQTDTASDNNTVPKTDAFPKLYSCLGLSATPFSSDDRSFLGHVLGNEVFHYGFEEAVNGGVVSDFAIGHISVAFQPDEAEEYRILSEKIFKTLTLLYEEYPSLKHIKSDGFLPAVRHLAKLADMDPSDPAAAFLLLSYQRKEICILARERILCCAELLGRLCASPSFTQLNPSPKIIIFCERIVQAHELYRLLSRKRYRCGLYHSRMTSDARSRILQQFREGEIQILVTCRCLDEGIDVPDANAAIVLSTSSASRQRIQRLGRIIRKSDNKNTALLYYLHVSGAVEDSVFLTDVESARIFNLKYYGLEKTFSNEPYEQICRKVIEQAQNAGMDTDRLTEIRACMLQGLIMPDYMLPGKEKQRLYDISETTHIRNYWTVMKEIGRLFPLL